MRRLKKFISFAAAIMLALPVVAIAEMDSIGKLEFQKNCAACHGMDGTGQPARGRSRDSGPGWDFGQSRCDSR